MAINYQRIAQLKRKEVSNRKIAQLLNVSRNRVNSIVEKYLESGCSLMEIESMTTEEILSKIIKPNQTNLFEKRESYVLPDYESLGKELAKPGVSMQLLWEEYVDSCKRSGSNYYQLTQFKKYFREHLEKAEFTEVIHHKAGEIIEVDWDGTKAQWIDPDTGEEVKGYLFVGVLAFSGYAYAEVCADMKLASWIDVHNHMYEYFGGVSRILVPDNLKTGVIKHTTDEVILNKTYSDMADYYGTIIIPTRVRKPKDKPLVENTVGKLTTAIIARMRNYQFFSINEYNQQLRVELDRFNEKPFQKKKGSRKSVFEEYEKETLLPLPNAPYELCEWRKAKVQNNSHIAVKRNYYSVPYKYIGQTVDVKLTSKTLTVYDCGTVIAAHPLETVRIGRYSTVDEHMPPSSGRYTEWNSTRYLNWAKTKGQFTYEVIRRIFQDAKNEQQYYRMAHSILKLADKYSNERLEHACEYALMLYTSPTYRNLKNIIATDADLTEEATENKAFQEGGTFVRGGDYYE